MEVERGGGAGDVEAVLEVGVEGLAQGAVELGVAEAVAARGERAGVGVADDRRRQVEVVVGESPRRGGVAPARVVSCGRRRRL